MISVRRFFTTYRQLIMCLLLVTMFISSFNISASGQAVISPILMTDTQIHAHLQSNGTTIVYINSNVTNRQDTTIDYIDFRVDVRNIEVINADSSIGISGVSVVPEDKFSVLRLSFTSGLPANESSLIYVAFNTSDLQEQYEICQEKNLCLQNMIFYHRPLNEFRNFTFIATLPPHSLLAYDVSPPLYPNPTSNFTDGTGLGFVWSVNQILPGQEKVYIIKYGLPMLIEPTGVTDTNTGLLVILAAMIGAIGVLVIERTPRFLNRIKSSREVKQVQVTSHENDVLRLLKQKGGSCPQRLIYEELDMSQSLASMVLTGLEERGLIKRFRDGRENVVHIIED